MAKKQIETIRPVVRSNPGNDSRTAKATDGTLNYIPIGTQRVMKVRAVVTTKVRYGAIQADLEKDKVYEFPLEFAKWLQDTGRVI